MNCVLICTDYVKRTFLDLKNFCNYADYCAMSEMQPGRLYQFHVRTSTHPNLLYNRANREQMKKDRHELHCDCSEPGDTTDEDLWQKFKVTVKDSMIENIYQQRHHDKRNVIPGFPWKSGSCFEDGIGSTKR